MLEPRASQEDPRVFGPSLGCQVWAEAHPDPYQLGEIGDRAQMAAVDSASTSGKSAHISLAAGSVTTQFFSAGQLNMCISLGPIHCLPPATHQAVPASCITPA